MNNKWKTYECKRCSKLFTGDEDRKYCSLECCWNYRRENPDISKIIHKCKKCKILFQDYSYNKKYCSQRCYWTDSTIQKERYDKCREKRECIICRNLFLVRKLLKKKYCSHKCYWTDWKKANDSHIKYRPDIKKLKKWTPQLAYIFGLICADGCMFKKTNTIMLFSIDKDMLIKFRDYIGVSNLLIRTRIQSYFKQKGIIKNLKHISVAYELSIRNKELFAEFTKKGLEKPKYNRLVPKVPLHYFNYFILGFFDGDGNACYYKKGSIKSISLDTGNKRFLIQVRKILYNKFAIKSSFYTFKNNCSRLQFSNIPAKQLYNIMYDNKSIPFCLQRKYTKLKEMFSDA